ncbi:MAG: FHA domain-containing protein [Myxococcales bacterium FL481]|nr:MAG: FHA domain-containing protein [Myxococcales bacterium FL481]
MALVTIAVSIDGAAASTFRFDRSPIRIGRNERNDVAVSHASVSGWHAMIRFDAHSATFVDLGSTNGTFAQGQRLHANAPLSITVPVELRIDKVRLQISFEPGATAPSEPVAARSAPAPSQPAPAPAGGPTGESRRPSPPAATQLPAPRDLRQLASRLLPTNHQPHGPEEQAAFADKLAVTLRVFAESFIRLQDQLDQLESELGTSLLRDRGPLQQASNAEELLAYLLDFRPPGPERSGQLAASFEQLMVHQVALFNAMLVGARAALRPLDPEIVEQATSGRWPTPAHARWQTYRRRFTEAARDAALVRAVFGEAFVDAYQQYQRDE